MTVLYGKFLGIDWSEVERHVSDRDAALALALKITGAPGGHAFYTSHGIRIELDPIKPPAPPERFTAQEYIDAMAWGGRSPSHDQV